MDAKVCPCPNCIHQGQPQPIENFSRNSGRADGRSGWCKSCMCSATTRWYATPSGKLSLKKHKHTEKGIAARKRYEQSQHFRDKRRDRRQNDILYRQRLQARSAVNHAIRDGKLPEPESLFCIECNIAASQYHHHLGYDKEHWLDVVPMCMPCHLEADGAQPHHISI